MRSFVRLFWALYLCFGLLLVAAMTADAASWARSIRAEWGYAPPLEPAVEGFVLYQAGKEVCRWEGADLRAGSCEVVLSATATEFTLTAAFADLTESPHSAPFRFEDQVPAPIINTITR